MKDISLYGHLTIDTILDGLTEKKTLGSMANVWKSLVELDPSLQIGLSPIDIGQALIYIDRESSKRYSKASLNLQKSKAIIHTSKIHHLVYLNEMTITDFIPTLHGIISADVCPGKPLNKDILQHVDYLFISDEDVDDFSSLVDATKGWVILHHSTGSTFSNGEQEYFWKLPEDKVLDNVNVLGAGDIFASCFLYKLLGETYDIHKFIEFAHLKTTEIIHNYSR
jgi:sugar/nucleoside kinase (ribokinase family)